MTFTADCLTGTSEPYLMATKSHTKSVNIQFQKKLLTYTKLNLMNETKTCYAKQPANESGLLYSC